MTQAQATSRTKKSLPEGWRWVRLGEVALHGPDNGVFKRREDFGSGVPIVNVSDLYRSLYVDMSLTERVRVTENELNRYQIAQGDLFFCRSSLKREGIGWCCFVKELQEPSVFDCHVMRVRLRLTDALPEFVAYYWQHPSVREYVIGNARTATMTTMNQQDLANIMLPLPPIEKQQQITKLLREQMATVDKARAAAQARLDEVKALPAAFLHRVFPQPDQALPNGWRWARLGDVAATTSGTTPIRSNSAYYGGNIPWIKTGELRDGFIEQAEEYVTSLAIEKCSLPLLPPETLLVAMYGQGQTRGRTGLLKIQATTNQACFAILPNEKIFLPYYLQAWFRHNYQQIRSETESRGGNQPNLNGQILKDMVIPLPSLDTQQQIMVLLREQLVSAEKLRSIAEEELQTINAVPATLLRRAFSGEI